MKKIQLLIATVLGIFAVVSCEQEIGGPETAFDTTVINASIESTKTALGEKDGTAWPNYWKAGDQISINGVASEALDAEADGKSSASFSFSGAVATPYYAAYPAAAVSDYSNGSATITVPASQSYVAGSYDPAAFVMFGKSETESSVALAPFVSVFHLSLTGSASITSVKLTGGDGAALSGSFSTDFETAEPKTVSNVVELVADAPVALPAEFFICVPAGLSGPVVVDIYDADSGSKSVNATIKSPLVGGVVYSPAPLAYSAGDGPSISVEGITSSTAIICVDGAAADAYTFNVYSDEACSVLVNSYAVDAGNSCWGEAAPRFCISGLEPSTTYYVKVLDVTGNAESAALPVTTKAFTIVEVSSAPAGVGDVILAEDFGELRWDSELINSGVGYFPTSQDSFANSEVDTFLPIDTNSEKTLGSQTAALAFSRLAHWAQGANNNLYIHPGYIKIVGSKKVTHIVTPALDNIPEGKIATLEVELTASAYYSGSSATFCTKDAIVAVQAPGEFNELTSEKKTNTLDLSSKTAAVTLTEETAWNTYKVTLSGVVKGSRIAFGAAKDVSGNDARMNLSDIKVTIKELDDPGIFTSVKSVSSSTAAFSWTYGGSAEEDIAKPYTIALYSDSACKNLVVSFDIEAEASCWDGKSPCFVFGGLNPSTEYWFRVQDTESGTISKPLSATTEAFTPVDVTTVNSVSAGDVILAEDFSEIGAGPDEFSGAASFVPSSKVLPVVPSGVNPDGSLVKSSSTGDRIFGAGWDLGDSRLSHGWGFFGNSAVYYQNGFLRVSTSSSGARTHVVTPVLSCIPAGKVATIEVTVTTCKYESNANDVAVFVEKGLKMDGQTNTNDAKYKKYTGASLSDGHALGITAVKNWETKSVTISNVDSDCQLVIGSLENIEGKNRFFLSDVKVTVTELKEPGVMASVKSVSSSSAAFSWTYGGETDVDVAKPYKIALYRNSACTDLVVSFNIGAEDDCWAGKKPCFVFGGLQPSTEYWFQVQDTENGSLSDPVSATTKAFTVVDPNIVSNAAVGDVILAEDFSELSQTPDELAGAAGFVPSPHKLVPAPSGVNPSGDFVKYDNTGNRVFGSGWDISGSRMENGWGFFGNSACYSRNGYLRMASSTGRTHIVTPALSGIPDGKLATLEVTVTACKYEANDNDVAVFVSNKCDMNEATDPGSASFHKYSIDGSTTELPDNGVGFGITSVKSWETKSVTVTNVDSGCQLIIGSLENISGKNRFYISDVKVVITALENDPVFCISNETTFNSFVSKVAGGNKTLEAKVTKDVTLSSSAANAFASIEDYAGTLNGNGNTISGLTKPLFNNLKGTVNDLKVSSKLNITADMVDIGILANVLSGTVDGCTSQGSVTFNVAGGVTQEHRIGGLIGKAAESGATVTDCTNEATVTNATASAGGNEGELIIGGVVGCFWGTQFNISGCKNTGAVSNNAAWNKAVSVGGIIGQAGNTASASCDLSVADCTNSGAISNTGNSESGNYVGGIVAWVRFGTYDGNSNSGAISNSGEAPNNYTGGLIGYVHINATFLDNSNSGTVSNTGDATSANYLGGIMGYVDKNCKISDAGSSAQYKLTNSGDIVNGGSAKNICIGGLFGRNSSGYFNMTGTSSKYSSNSGNITDNSGPAKSNGGDLSIGGIAGYTTTGIKTQYARNSGNIYVTGDKGNTSVNVGGIGGWIDNASLNFNNCRNTGNITVDCTTTVSIWVAGIVGCPKDNATVHYYWRSNATIDTHAATVGGENYTAGLVGSTGSSANTLTMYGHRLAGTVWGNKTTTGLFCCTRNAESIFSFQGGTANPNMIAPGTVRKDDTHTDTINDIADVNIGVLAGGAGSTYDISSAISGEHIVVKEW